MSGQVATFPDWRHHDHDAQLFLCSTQMVLYHPLFWRYKNFLKIHRQPVDHNCSRGPWDLYLSPAFVSLFTFKISHGATFPQELSVLQELSHVRLSDSHSTSNTVFLVFAVTWREKKSVSLPQASRKSYLLWNNIPTYQPRTRNKVLAALSSYISPGIRITGTSSSSVSGFSPSDFR